MFAEEAIFFKHIFVIIHRNTNIQSHFSFLLPHCITADET